jgi:hypothetical protein
MGKKSKNWKNYFSFFSEDIALLKRSAISRMKLHQGTIFK